MRTVKICDGNFFPCRFAFTGRNLSCLGVRITFNSSRTLKFRGVSVFDLIFHNSNTFIILLNLAGIDQQGYVATHLFHNFFPHNAYKML